MRASLFFFKENLRLLFAKSPVEICVKQMPIILLAFLSFNLFSQHQVAETAKQFTHTENATLIAKNKIAFANGSSHYWLNFGQSKLNYETALGNISSGSYKIELLPVLMDSVAKSSDGKYIQDMRAGITFDPKSIYFDPSFSGTQLVTKTESYTIDSLVIGCYYQRRNNISDTLKIEICWSDTSDTNVFTKWGFVSPFEFLTPTITPSFQHGDRAFLSAPASKKIILKRVLNALDADTSLSNPWRFSIAVDVKALLGYALDIPAGNIAGISCTFVPGEKYNPGDVCYADTSSINTATKNGLGIIKLSQTSAFSGNLFYDAIQNGYKGWNTTLNYSAVHRYNKNATLILNVLDFGADPTGNTDCRSKIQQAIDSLNASGGGVLKIPLGTYLLDSWTPSPHPWIFCNLRVGSNITIEADSGATLLQGENGRHPVLNGATEVINTVLVVGTSNWSVTTFQNAAYNGGYYDLAATNVNDTLIKFNSANSISNFKVGDYIAIYESKTGDVIPTETAKIISVDSSNGILGLNYPILRAFSNPSVVKVTGLATKNVAIKNLTIQGAIPLTGTEMFGFTAENCTLIVDKSIGGLNALGLINMNTIIDYTFKRCTFTSIGGYANAELPQRNSRYGAFDGCTFNVKSIGFGEYVANMSLVNNHIWLYPDSTTNAGIFLGGLDVDFSGNDVHGMKNLIAANAGGWGGLIVDVLAPSFYVPYTGKIKITNNTIDCKADGNSGIILLSDDPLLMNNNLTITGSANGIRSEGPTRARIEGNTVSVESGYGLLLSCDSLEGNSVVNNTLQGGTGSFGIYVVSPAAPNTGVDVFANNILTGFNTDFFLDLSKHPNAQISGAYSDTALPLIYDITEKNSSNSSVEIKWTTDELCSSQIEYGMSNLYGQTSAWLDLNGSIRHKLQLNNLQLSTTYHFRIIAKDPSGNTRISADQIFTTPINTRPDFFDFIHLSSEKEIWDITTVISKNNIGTSLPEHTGDAVLQAIPNPSVDAITLYYNLSNAAEVTLQICDLTGKKIFDQHCGIQSKGTHNLQINTEALQAGIYFCKLVSNNITRTNRLVVLK